MPRGSNFKKPYPPEFRREAVGLYRSSGRSLNEVAGDLGISTERRHSRLGYRSPDQYERDHDCASTEATDINHKEEEQKAA